MRRYEEARQIFQMLFLGQMLVNLFFFLPAAQILLLHLESELVWSGVKTMWHQRFWQASRQAHQQISGAWES